MQRLLCLALALGTALSSGRAAAPADATKTYRNPVHKFSVRIYRDWAPVPQQPGEEILVAEFVGDAFGRPGLSVVRVKRRTPTTGASEAQQSEKEAKGEGEEPEGPASALEALLGKEPAPDAEFEEITSSDDVPGKLWRLESAGRFQTLAVFSQGGVEYGLRLSCAATQRAKYENAFKSIARSFKYFDKDARDVKEREALEDVNLTPERRQEIEAGLVAGWDVEVSPKRNYVVIYNTKGGENDLLAKVIATRIEKIREQIYEEQFPPARKIDAVSIVRVCADRDEYMQYGGSPSSAGYWNSRSEELVFYDNTRSRSVGDDTIAVLYHEAFHQYIFYSVGQVSPHSWFNEGHGDYYAGAVYRAGRFRIEPFDWRVNRVKDAFRKGPRSSTAGGYVPLAEIIRYSQKEYYSYASICYAQGWSLIYFLREVVPRKSSYRKKWGHILDVYFTTLKEEVEKRRAEQESGQGGGGGEKPDPDGGGDGNEEGESGQGDEDEEEPDKSALAVAVERAFEGIDLAELEDAWITTILKL